jgi:GT2 family glycosyltransferase
VVLWEAQPVRVSICTPVKNQVFLLDDFARAVEGADEVILIDNASEPANGRKIRSISEKKGWRYHRNDKNLWFSTATNQAMKMATGDVLVALNSDVWKSGEWIQQARETPWGVLLGPSLVRKKLHGISFGYLEGWCIAGRRETWEALEYFDEVAYPMPYWEDTDLCLRAEHTGIRVEHRGFWPIHHKGSVTARHTVGAGSADLDNRTTFLQRLWAFKRIEPVSA